MSTSSGQREQVLVEAFVRLADTLVTDFDVIDVFNRLCADCVRLLGVDAAGLMISDQRGSLQVVAASSEAAQVVELFQLQADQGPCLDCFRTSTLVRAEDLTTEGRWPLFTARARALGMGAVHALPMRLRQDTIGGLNLFHSSAHALPDEELAVGQALADAATIAILSARRARESETLTEQLQNALTSRVIIEQAKGMLAGRGRIGLDDAFARLRSHARSTNSRLTDLARAIVDGSHDPEHLLRPDR